MKVWLLCLFMLFDIFFLGATMLMVHRQEWIEASVLGFFLLIVTWITLGLIHMSETQIRKPNDHV